MPGIRWILDLTLGIAVVGALLWFTLAGNAARNLTATVPEQTAVTDDSALNTIPTGEETIDSAAVRRFAALFPRGERPQVVAPPPPVAAAPPPEPVANGTRFALVSSVRTPDGGTAYYLRDNRAGLVVSTLDAEITVIELAPESELVFDYRDERFVVRLR